MRNQEKISLELYNEYLISRNESLFDKFLNSIKPPLKTKIKFYVKNESDVDEVLQKTLIKLNELRERINYIQDKKSLINWIFMRITYGYILHYFRDIRYSANLDIDKLNIGNDDNSLVHNSFVDNNNPEKNLLKNENITKIHQAIFKIRKPKMQDVIILTYYTQMELQLIANLMGENYATVRTWHNRAKEELKTLLKRMID